MSSMAKLSINYFAPSDSKSDLFIADLLWTSLKNFILMTNPGKFLADRT